MIPPVHDDARPALCFGEALWDVFADGMRPGGAPLNVAVHLRRLGHRAVPFTAVGRDDTGDRLMDVIAQQGLTLAAVSRHATLPTGRVDVTIDSSGEPVYDIRGPAAWDEIEPTSESERLAATASALVFGTLAQRSDVNRRTLDRLLEAVPSDALRVLDVNLRPPHVDPQRLWELARQVDLLKVNRAELATLVVGNDIERMARELAGELDEATTICVTMGVDGAALLRDGAWHVVPAENVEVVDQVGAGDAFVAGLVDALLAGRDDDAALRSASRLAGSVAAHAGAW